MKGLIGFTIGATDGDIGTIKDFYFEDNSWVIRYLVVETGNWLNDRKVLITPEALLMPVMDSKVLEVNLTKEQVRSSPDVDTELPVYRQQEIILYDHYALGNYWRGGFIAGGIPLPMDEVVLQQDQHIDDKVRDNDLHLRSAVNVSAYNVMARDGFVGDIKDFLINEKGWKIDYIVVDTGNWLPRKKVLLSPKWIKEIKWDISTVIVDLKIDNIRNSPEYDQSLPVSDAYSRNLHTHYMRSV